LKIGARFLNNTWRLKEVPSNYLNAITMGKIRDQQKIQAILDKMGPVEVKKEKINLIVGKIIDKIDDSITVKAQFSDEQKKEIAKNYTDNMELTIKGWQDEQIKKLRLFVGEQVRAGRRHENIYKDLVQKYDLLPKRARFIARQEVNLLATQMQEQKCRRAGLNKYVWRTREDSKVRKDHEHLDGEIFDWDHPPVVDLRTGRRGHPGQDFNCRCYAISILE